MLCHIHALKTQYAAIICNPCEPPALSTSLVLILHHDSYRLLPDWNIHLSGKFALWTEISCCPAICHHYYHCLSTPQNRHNLPWRQVHAVFVVPKIWSFCNGRKIPVREPGLVGQKDHPHGRVGVMWGIVSVYFGMWCCWIICWEVKTACSKHFA